MIIAALVIVVAICGWVLLSGDPTASVKKAGGIREDELEDAYIELKKKILVTNVYDNESEYQRIYRSMKELLGKIIARHSHFILEAEAAGHKASRVLMPREGRDSSGMPTSTYVVPYNTDPATVEPALLLYLCFFLYQGGQIRALGRVDRDERQMMRFLDYLVVTKEYPPALFFKGLVLKYGCEVYQAVHPSEARYLLEAAKAKGVGAATIELLQLHKYAGFEGIKAVNS